jgi:hypothetical protein
MDIVPYGGWRRCVRLSDGEHELVATLEVGPRVIRFAFVGGRNAFVEYPAQLGKTGGTEYRSYGGHRLWTAPEVRGRTNLPDNAPVELNQDQGWIVLTAPVEGQSFLQRELRLRLHEGTAQVEHRVYNRGLYAVELAPWAITVMAAGGVGLFPQEPPVPHAERVLPVRPLVLWGYTEMADARWTWGPRLVRLRQTDAPSFQKVGALVTEGWAGYHHQDQLFLKRFPCDTTARYPDFGCNFEMFTRHDMLEIESLGPAAAIPPGGFVTHPEAWRLVRGLALPADDAAAAELLHPLATALLLP